VLFKEITYLFKKELTLEFRQKYAIGGMLLYLISSIFLTYFAFKTKVVELHPIVWNAVYWLVILFTAINSVAKSFIQERQGLLLYYYTIASPVAVILAKMAYNAVLLMFLGLTGFLFFSLFLGNPVQDITLYLITIILASIGFSSSLTLISGIASKASNSNTLMAVMGFPILIPSLLMIIKVSKNAIDGLERSVSYQEMGVLSAIIMIVVASSILLFPYLWKSS